MATEVKLNDIKVDDILNESNKLVQTCHERKKGIIEAIQVDPLKDARPLHFTFWLQTFQTYQIALHLTKEIHNLPLVKEKLENQPEEVSKKVNTDLVYMHLDEMKAAMFIAFFVNFELTIRIIATECFRIKIGQRGDLVAVVTQIIDSAKIDPAFKQLCEILLYSRNTMHFGGIRSRENYTVNYRGKEYQFREGEPLDFFDFPGMFYLFNETMEFFSQLFLSEPVKGVKEIIHPYSGFAMTNK